MTDFKCHTLYTANTFKKFTLFCHLANTRSPRPIWQVPRPLGGIMDWGVSVPGQQQCISTRTAAVYQYQDKAVYQYQDSSSVSVPGQQQCIGTRTEAVYQYQGSSSVSVPGQQQCISTRTAAVYWYQDSSSVSVPNLVFFRRLWSFNRLFCLFGLLLVFFF